MPITDVLCGIMYGYIRKFVGQAMSIIFAIGWIMDIQSDFSITIRISLDLIKSTK